MKDNAQDTRLYGLLIVFVAVLALAGYAGYLIYPRFDLPASSGVGLLVLSAAAGIASFFSPCSFPLLITVLARRAETRHPLYLSAALAFGAATFLLLVGILVAVGGGALFQDITFENFAGRILRLVVGGFLVLLGLLQLNLLPSPGFRALSRLSESLSRLQARQRRRRPMLGFAIFGFGYPLAGFG